MEQQYLDLLKAIKENGTHKPAARENMPGTTSLFGYQMRHNLQRGFPLLTTKKMYWKGVVVELLWFLRGDTNIKFLMDHGVNIWNEDAYAYYCKIASGNLDINANSIYFNNEDGTLRMFKYDEFVEVMKINDRDNLPRWDIGGYTLGDCGYQYGKTWRDWDAPIRLSKDEPFKGVDQIARVINALRNNPASRRHIVTAIDPANDDNLALYWCHAMFQFNCREIDYQDRVDLAIKGNILVEGRSEQEGSYGRRSVTINPEALERVAGNGVKSDEQIAEWIQENGGLMGFLDKCKVKKYWLDCQLYQRSADVFLGVPFNIASYALLTHTIAEMCNMIPGEFIHTFGDVHIYDNHMEAVDEQLSRTPNELPKLEIHTELRETDADVLEKLSIHNFKLSGYIPQDPIKAELSTGITK